MFKTENLDRLRREMVKNGDKSYLILAGDPHSSEYVAPAYAAERFFFAPFSGSDGTLVVTLEGAYLFTDGRYFIQAEKELKDSGVTLMKMGTRDCPTVENFIVKNKLFPCASDLFLTPQTVYEKLSAGGKVVDRSYSYLVPPSPAVDVKKIFVLDSDLTTLTAAEKIRLIAAETATRNAEAVLITTLDDIAYILNWRGGDIDCTPVFYAFLYLTIDEKVHLFIDNNKLEMIDTRGIEIHDYEEITSFVEANRHRQILVDRSKINARLFNLLLHPVDGKCPSYHMKAIKGPAEIRNIKAIHESDGVAMLKFYDFLYSRGGSYLTEYEYALALEKFRRQSKLCFGLSFETIAAVDANAAEMHYGPTAAKSSIVAADATVLLVDSGGQYYGGTTDITRTFILREPSAELKKDYTLTLKSLINLSRTVFIEGCSGFALDIKAREIMWREGMDYKCGTGHGVGYILGVHEGPNGFRYKHVPERDDGSELVPGMITTVEPGVYKADKYGIRIENELLTVPAFETSDGVFYRFETITYCPIETKYLDLSLLSVDEIAWINEYHQTVYEKLLKHLDGNQRLIALLRHLTKPLVS